MSLSQIIWYLITIMSGKRNRPLSYKTVWLVSVGKSIGLNNNKLNSIKPLQINQVTCFQVAQSVLFRKREENITQGKKQQKKKISKLLSEAALKQISSLNDPSCRSNTHLYFTLKLISWDTNLFQINRIFSLFFKSIFVLNHSQSVPANAPTLI